MKISNNNYIVCPMRVGLFIPCYVNLFYPNVGIATLELLEKYGCQVEYPQGQTCCGQPIANSGYESKAKDTYLHFVNTFQKYDYIVAPSGSCTYHVKKHYDIIDQDEKVKRVRSQTYDLTDFLLEIVKVDIADASFPHKVSLHQSCHGLRGLRTASGSERLVTPYNKWEELLSNVKGLQLVQTAIKDECCGFGGTFSIEEPELSVKMGKDKIKDSINSEAEYITSGDMSCLMHLDGVIRRNQYPIKVIHIAEILNSRI